MPSRLQSSIWWRGRVQWKDSTVITMGKVTEYDPFDMYFDIKDVSQKASLETRSLVYQFLRVNPAKPEEVVKFCERFGALGDPQGSGQQCTNMSQKPGLLNQWLGQPSLSDAQRRELSLIGTSPSSELVQRRMTFDEFEQEQAGLRRTLDLTGGLANRRASRSPRKADYSELQERFAGRLNALRPNMKWDKDTATWKFHWDAFSLVGILYLMVLLDLQGPGRILKCGNCHEWFLGRLPRDRFCQSSCRFAHKQRAYRMRKKKAAKRLARVPENKRE